MTIILQNPNKRPKACSILSDCSWKACQPLATIPINPFQHIKHPSLHYETIRKLVFHEPYWNALSLFSQMNEIALTHSFDGAQVPMYFARQKMTLTPSNFLRKKWLDDRKEDHAVFRELVGNENAYCRWSDPKEPSPRCWPWSIKFLPYNLCNLNRPLRSSDRSRCLEHWRPSTPYQWTFGYLPLGWDYFIACCNNSNPGWLWWCLY